MTTAPSTPQTIPVQHRPIGMHEFVLEVADLEVSDAFYREVIGLPEVARWTGERKAVWFDLGDTVALGLWTKATSVGALHDGRGGAHVHFALRMPHGSIDDAESRLQQLGYETTRIAFDDGNNSVYVTDPDGHCVEMMDAIVDWADEPLP